MLLNVLNTFVQDNEDLCGCESDGSLVCLENDVNHFQGTRRCLQLKRLQKATPYKVNNGKVPETKVSLKKRHRCLLSQSGTFAFFSCFV